MPKETRTRKEPRVTRKTRKDKEKETAAFATEKATKPKTVGGKTEAVQR